MKNNIKKAPVKFWENLLYFQHFMQNFKSLPRISDYHHLKSIIIDHYNKYGSQICILFHGINRIYFIPSSEFNAYLKQVKVILSLVKKYRIISLVMNTI